MPGVMPTKREQGTRQQKQVTEKKMRNIEDTYAKLKAISGDDIEPLASVQLVDAYRRYWKPEAVSVVLLAESHVFTCDEDRRVVCPCPPDLPGYPTQYARFVYCLGYGERRLTRCSSHPRYDGTPQFWKLLYCCNNPIDSLVSFAPILGKTPFESRIRNKIALLKDLKAKGIWLVDASIVALYRNQKRVPAMTHLLAASWHSYTKEIIAATRPQHVICVGKGVAGVVERDLKKLCGRNYTIIPQPNAHLTAAEHFESFRLCGKICRVPCAMG